MNKKTNDIATFNGCLSNSTKISLSIDEINSITEMNSETKKAMIEIETRKGDYFTDEKELFASLEI